MATIVVEDGTAKTNSNSYASEAELSTYATDRGVTISGTAAVLLIQSMDWIETRLFAGDKYSEAQALQWPRVNVVLDGFSVDYNEIPTILKEAQMEIAISIDGGTNPMSNQERRTIREKVGEVEVEYDSSSRSSTYITSAEQKIKKLLKSWSGGSLRVIRA